MIIIIHAISHYVTRYVTPYYKQRYLQKRKKASSTCKLVVVKWCDIHKKWYIKVYKYKATLLNT